MNRAPQKPAWSLIATRCVTIAVLTACGGGAAAPPNTPPNTPPPDNTTAAIAVAPNVLNLVLGGTGSLGATAYNSAGATVSGVTVAWASASPGVATVTTAGLVTGVGVGTTAVTATVGGAQGSAIVNVLNPATVASLQIAPSTAGTTVGGSVPFSVIAYDATGAIVAAPPVAWTSSTPTVASVAANGTAIGLTVGSTQIQATAGALIATASLTVSAAATAACGGIANQARWLVRLSLSWAAAGVNSANHRITAEHTALIDGGPMSQVLANQTTSEWTSDPGLWGYGSINDSDTNLGSQPQTTETLRGADSFAATLAGQQLPRLVLQADLTTCSYRFEMPVQMTMTLTRSDGTTQSAVLALGALYSAWIPLHPDWKQANLEEVISAPFPAHSLGWIIAGNAISNVYVPFGFGQLLFSGQSGANEAPQGNATVTAAFTPIP